MAEATMKPVSQPVKFNNKNQADFFATLRKRVNGYFEETGKTRYADRAMFAKTAFILIIYAALYGVLIGVSMPFWATLIVWACLGFFVACIGLNIGHDAIHGTYAPGNSFYNRVFRIPFNLVGANDYMWHISHNVAHHTFTNIPGHDEDINQPDIVRFSPSQPLKPHHKYQYLYVLPLYGFSSISWVFVKDYVRFFKGRIGNYVIEKHPTREWVRLFAYKFAYYAYMVVLPFVLIDLPWWQILIGFVLMHAVAGITMGTIFALAHLVEETHFPMPDEQGQVENSWAAHQLYTTANFARKDPLINFFAGGLNFQVEHHLFPNICHTHYTKLAPIVKQTAQEFGLPYYDTPTFGQAFMSHIRFLKRFGTVKDPFPVASPAIASN